MRTLTAAVICCFPLAAACDKPGNRAASTAPASAAVAASRPVTPEGQSVCPVSGYDVDPEVFVEYRGKRVYFCCEGCAEPFQEKPDQFLSVLAQFGGSEKPSRGRMPH